MVERISALIKQNGLSLNAVEKQLGFGNGAIKRFDTNSPSIDKISSLAIFLNTSIDYLVFGEEKDSPTNNLSENEIELLEVFNKFNDREQIKLIGKLEELFRQKEIKENQKTTAFKVARSTDGQFRKTELSEEELKRIHDLPEDTDF